MVYDVRADEDSVSISPTVCLEHSSMPNIEMWIPQEGKELKNKPRSSSFMSASLCQFDFNESVPSLKQKLSRSHFRDISTNSKEDSI